MVSNKILRKNAKRQLGGNIFKERWMNMLVACLIPTAVSALMTVFGVGLLACLVNYPLAYGLARVCVRCVEGRKWGYDNLFDGFKERFGRCVGLGLLQGIFLVLWAILFFPIAIVKTYSYSMSYYIAQEKSNDYSANECITKSREMMDGYKWRLFCLDFSFIGWYILGVLCFGFGVLFVVPYHQVARANFYEALKAGGENGNGNEGVEDSSVGEETPMDSYDVFFEEASRPSETEEQSDEPKEETYTKNL